MPRTRPQSSSHRCIVPGCLSDGRNRLGVRCRIAHGAQGPFPAKRRTSALWSASSEEVTIDAIATTIADRRTIPIKQP